MVLDNYPADPGLSVYYGCGGTNDGSSFCGPYESCDGTVDGNGLSCSKDLDEETCGYTNDEDEGGGDCTPIYVDTPCTCSDLTEEDCGETNEGKGDCTPQIYNPGGGPTFDPNTYRRIINPVTG